jgi:tetratricopeptide (TPR) repeat protein
MSQTGTPKDAFASHVVAAAARLAADPAGAEQDARRLLQRAPQDPRLLLILGSALRRQGKAEAAFAVIAPLAKAWPRAANTQYEMGAIQRALGALDAAAQALRLALSLNPDLAEAWRALGDLLFLQGDAAGAEDAFLEFARASVTVPHLKPAALDIRHGRLDAAEARLRAHLLQRSGDADALAMLGDVYLRQGRWADAEVLFTHVLETDPGSTAIRFNLANALFLQQKAPEGLAEINRLLEQAPDTPAYRNLQAACLALIGDHETVNRIYEDLLVTYGRQPKIWLNYGHSLRAVGRQEDAVAAYRRSIALAPGLGEAYWSLANLKVVKFTPAEDAAITRMAEMPTLADDDRIHLHYALGKAREDAGQSAQAFAHFARGAALRRARTPYNIDELAGVVARSRALFTPEMLADRQDAGSQDDAPIFIVGLPRSGSTLIEQILASHSRVEGTMELPDINHMVQDLIRAIPGGASTAWPDLLGALTPARLKALGDDYIARTRVHRVMGRPLFIDKMPNNFQHVGFIRLILPRARIIDARRHPMGACFSAFKQHFAHGQDFSYDLGDLGAYYQLYIELMRHFDAVAPGTVHRVIYEDLVEDTEGEVRRLLAACGLAFEPDCLEFYRNTRAVRTVSSEQVRQPIFREGLDQWRHYEAWLAPLAEALGPALEHWRD